MKTTQKLLLAMLLCMGTGVQADTLKGMTKVEILIEGLNENHAKCGITNDMLDAAVRLPLSNSQLKTTQFGVGQYLYVNTNALPISGGCAVSYKLELKKIHPI